MYSIQETTEAVVIKELLSYDNVYNSLAYDYSPCLDAFVPDVSNSVWFILFCNKKAAGIITLQYLNYTLWIPHIFIYKAFRGEGSEQWGKLVAQEMKIKYGAKKFLALTPYKNAKKYAEKVGFKHVHTLTESVQKNGILMDQYMLEMTS